MTKTRRHLGAAAVLIAAGLIAYFNSLQGVWLFDDYSYIIDNPFVRELWNFGSGYPHPYRPVLEWTFSLNFAFGETGIYGYHLFNLVVHILAALTLYGVVRRTLCRTGHATGSTAAGLSLSISLLWLLHPLQTESVTYISQRSESLMGLTLLFCLYALIRASEAEDSRERTLWHLAVVTVFWIGCGVKEIMAAGLVILPVYDRIFLSDSWASVHRKRWLLYTGCFAAVAWLAGTSDRMNTSPETMAMAVGIVVAGNHIFNRMYPIRSEATGLWVRGTLVFLAGTGIVLVALLGLSQLLNNMERYTSVTPPQYAISQLGVIAHYLRLALWPSPLILDHDWPVTANLSDVGPAQVVTIVLILAALIGTWKHPAIGFPILAFGAILAPTSSIIPLRDLAVEHRMYLPLASVISLTVLGGHVLLRRYPLPGRKAVQIGLVCIPALMMTVGTIDRNEKYQQPMALWQEALDHYPAHKRVHLNLAQLFTQRLDHSVAYTHYQNGLPFTWLSDDLGAKVYYNFGITLHALNQDDAAATQFRLAARLVPVGMIAASSHNQLGLIAVEAQNMSQARIHFESAQVAEPGYAIAYKNLGVLYAMQNRWRRAREQLGEAVRLDPDFAEAQFALGEVHEQTGRLDQAARKYQTVLRINPNHIEARNRLAQIRERRTRRP